MNCPYCESDKLRNSQYRAEDLFQLLLLRLPVRCRNCQERSYVSIAKSRQLQRESTIRREKKRCREAERTSTEGRS